ncbi:MAG: mechanosensitive ion channel domain-containing protein [Burkholderiaceae bacterium]
MFDYGGFGSGALSAPLFTLGTASVTLGGLLAAIVFVFGVWWFAGLLERGMHRMTLRYSHEPGMSARIHLFSRMLRYGVWMLGTLLGLNYLGIDLTNVALLGSAFAVGLGFGLQNVVSNFVSGLIILFERSLKVGDFVDLESGVRGHVREIAMRYTRVTTNDALDVLVPNSEFINGRVANWTLDDADRRIHVPFGVAYGTPKELVREAGIEAARHVDGVIDREGKRTSVWLLNYGDSSVNYELIVWAERELTTHPARTHAALMWALDDELNRRNIEIPFPQRDLHVRSGALDVRVLGGGTEPQRP